MPKNDQRNTKSPWLGEVREKQEIPGSTSEFNGGKFWIGLHSFDRDTLVFDPVESDPLTERITFYSLTQHRTRTFPRSVVLRQIHEVTDDVGVRRARGSYENRVALRVRHSDAVAAAEVARFELQRQSVLDAHRRYLSGIGLEFQGVTPTPATHRPGRRTKCRVCGIALDDFASTVCTVCQGVLCSCGSCACVARAEGGDAS